MMGVAHPDRADHTHAAADQIAIAAEVFLTPSSFTAVYVPPFSLGCDIANRAAKRYSAAARLAPAAHAMLAPAPI